MLQLTRDGVLQLTRDRVFQLTEPLRACVPAEPGAPRREDGVPVPGCFCGAGAGRRRLLGQCAARRNTGREDTPLRLRCGLRIQVEYVYRSNVVISIYPLNTEHMHFGGRCISHLHALDSRRYRGVDATP